MVINPRIVTWGRVAMAFTKDSASSGAQPNLLSSAEVFTCTKMSRFRLSCASLCSNFCAVSRLSIDWIH